MSFRVIPRVLTLGIAGVLFASGAAFAATISGYVRETGSRESMPYVSVYLDGLRIGAMTNVSGYYVINAVPPGEHTLIASLIGYQEYREKVTVNTGPVVNNIDLLPEAIQLEQVTVVAERVKSPSLEIIPSRETLRGTDLKIAPAAVEADPIRTLQTLPGVVQLSDFNTGLYVRGGTPDQNLILMDGSELYNVSHMFGLFSTFPADAIKTTELLMGAYPAQYGGRLSSVLNVTTDEGDKEHFKGSGGISLLASRMTVQGPFARGSFLVSGRRTYLEPALWLAGIEDLGYYFYDFQGKVHQVLSHEDQFTIAGYLGRDILTYDDDFFRTRFAWGNQSAALTWTHLFSSTLYSHFQFNASHFNGHTTFKIEDVGIADENNLFDLDGKVDFTWFQSDRHVVETGFHLKRNTMRFEQEFGDQHYEAFDILAYVPSAYVQDSWRPFPFLTIQPGIRASYFRAESQNDDSDDHVSYSAVNPRLTVRYQFAENSFLKFGTGRYTQYIFRVPREFQGISVLSDIWFTCDSSASPQHAWHYVVGLETKLRDDIDLSVESYYKDYDGLAEFNQRTDAPQSAGDALLRGDGYSYGLDMNVKKRAGRHMGWLSYSISWSVRTIKDLNVNEEGVAEPFYPKHDSRHHVDAVYSFSIARWLTFTSRFAYGSGQPYTRVLGRQVIEDPIYVLDPIYRERSNADRLPYYMRLDVGLRGKFKGWGITWMPFLQIVNVLNNDNEFNRYWTDGDYWEQKRAEEKSIPQLPFLPTIGVDLEF